MKTQARPAVTRALVTAALSISSWIPLSGHAQERVIDVDLAHVRRVAGFRTIRMHGLLSDDMGVYRTDAKGNDVYNFQYIDALYDYLLSIGIRPFVELGFMPSALASGNKTIFWWRGNVTPPRSYEKWEKLVKALTEHWTGRYGRDEVAQWYFEVWNEPSLDGFWAGTQDEYFTLYRHAAAAAAIKSVDARYKVGGPATAGAAWVSETIAWCARNGVPIDFISTHTYGVNQGYLDEFGTTGTVLSKDEQSVSGDILRSRQQIAASALPKLELHYTEWSSSYTPADPTHDSYHQAAYILQKIRQAKGAAQSMSYWVFTDIFEEPGPRFEAFHGGFGLMNTQGIKKPAYFAYQFLNALAPYELENKDAGSYATTDGKGNAGYRQNDAYTAYIGMGSPAQLTRDQVAELKAAASGQPAERRRVTVGADGLAKLDFPLRENDVYLLQMTKTR